MPGDTLELLGHGCRTSTMGLNRGRSLACRIQDEVPPVASFNDDAIIQRLITDEDHDDDVALLVARTADAPMRKKASQPYGRISQATGTAGPR